MNPETKTIYTPPRPNLGPDPLVESPSWLGIAVAITLALAFLTYLVKRRRRKPVSTPSQVRPGMPDEGSISPRERMIAWSLTLRASLAETFGPSWLAKTTEEIARDPILADTLGPEYVTQLLAFLADADRTKFSDVGELPALTLDDSELRELIHIIATANSKVGPPLP